MSITEMTRGNQGDNHQTGRLLTPTQVAAALNVPRRRVVTRDLRKTLPWIKVGPRTLRLPASDLDAYLRSASPVGAD